MLNLCEVEGAVLLLVKIVPGASRTRIMGPWQGRLRIAVAAPPEKGRANEALIRFLADALNIARRDIDVVAGHTQPLKTIRIERVTADHIRSLVG